MFTLYNPTQLAMIAALNPGVVLAEVLLTVWAFNAATWS